MKRFLKIFSTGLLVLFQTCFVGLIGFFIAMYQFIIYVQNINSFNFKVFILGISLFIFNNLYLLLYFFVSSLVYQRKFLFIKAAIATLNDKLINENNMKKLGVAILSNSIKAEELIDLYIDKKEYEKMVKAIKIYNSLVDLMSSRNKQHSNGLSEEDELKFNNIIKDL